MITLGSSVQSAIPVLPFNGKGVTPVQGVQTAELPVGDQGVAVVRIGQMVGVLVTAADGHTVYERYVHESELEDA